ncbi:MarR family transcriptional regulator [Solibacillus sp. CAU 1738]|uniref:MarR family winged helix-turn-helix transcriptional regulator n=1 Tax=Solibacillus sp. CAU 1738 TaxID=3140363 RepID=UPI0032619359
MSPDNQQLFLQFEKLFWNLSKNMSYLWKGVFEERFPGSQSHILFLLERKGHLKMSEVAEALHLTPGAVTTASDKLIDNGYITRVRDEQDRRVVYLDMTKEGKEVLANLQKEARKVMQLVFSNLSETDLNFLISTFEQAEKNIKEMREE